MLCQSGPFHYSGQFNHPSSFSALLGAHCPFLFLSVGIPWGKIFSDIPLPLRSVEGGVECNPHWGGGEAAGFRREGRKGCHEDGMSQCLKCIEQCLICGEGFVDSHSGLSLVSFVFVCVCVCV